MLRIELVEFVCTDSCRAGKVGKLEHATVGCICIHKSSRIHPLLALQMQMSGILPLVAVSISALEEGPF